ncbi:outer membrane beta-barrel protein [Bradyrhizobium sp. BWA-3-5]|uniref:outer membrane beta-barrel protein n=1 Tax=Bradyrhizobium sp. BWA-3-5 TaxID=3080013 RepID=UPI00293E92E2|nr:outer membrane beta-barrel protein [Bradyrhizobium sp. BWA-3-5]WOH63680.1 outer membrane beta-barrel protein [Bradyrhizobium sp. BWA-3-5]
MRSERLFWGAATAAVVVSGAVHSADLGPAVKAPPVLWRWTGGYIGGQVGGGSGLTSFSDPYGPSIYGDVVETPVFLAGGQVGYNWQKDRWVFGLELDASGAVSDGTNTCLAFSGNVVIATCTASPNVFVTGTARIGYAVGPQSHTLVYVKGGVAWQNNRGEIANNNEFREDDFPGFPREVRHFDYSRFGGTVGLGIEQALTPAWSVKFEYDYMRFAGPGVATPPTVQFPPYAIVPANTSSLSSNYHVGKVGLNYHFGADPTAPERSDPPLYPTGATAKAAPFAYPRDWSLEGGSRLWLSRGKFQWDYIIAPVMPGDTGIPNSRLTYHGLDGISGELFGRLDSPWGIFLKSNIGIGRFDKGKMNDEDSSNGGEAYSNTISGQANGKFMYYTADAGYDFLRSSTYKVGAFVGWTYYGQKSDSVGCVQTVSPYPCLTPNDRRLIGSQDTDWNAPRIGLSAETALLERWRVSADVAYLPWTEFSGRDHHLLREETTFYDHRGDGGGGVQVEGILSYFLTENLSVGIGARYWAVWTKKDSGATYNCCGGTGTQIQDRSLAKYSMERWGTFFQASYKF